MAKVQAKVMSRFWDGSLEVVSALLPGESDEEVVVVAHLCHPQWSANDNASGSATILEMARTLHGLIHGSRLKKLRRSIRFLLVPEFTGTYAYLAAHEERLPKMIAGLNLDMVGESQELCGSTLVVERLPASTPAFSGDLLERLLEAVADASGAGGCPPFRYGSTPFLGGSDHTLLSDPMVAIPSPLLIQWPDKFYHTSLDTQDKVDPLMLARVGKVATTYAYFLALAGRAEATWLAWEMVTRFKQKLVRLVQEEGRTGGELTRKVDRLQSQGIEGMRSLRWLADIEVKGFESELSSFTRRELKNVPQLREEAKPAENEWEEQAGRMVPRRLYKGAIRVTPHLRHLGSQERERWWRLEHRYGNALWYLLPLTLYWSDGERTLHEVVDLVEMESGKRAAELLVSYCRTLSDLGLLDLLER